MATRRDRVDDRIGLAEAASRLGVHYMTAYRYVRLGELPATKVSGEWKVRLRDLERVARRPAAARGARGPDWSRYRSQFVTRLRAGDEPAAWAIVERALASGATARDVHLQLVGPSLRTIGDLWAKGRIEIAEEHRASAVASRIIGRMGPAFARRGRKRASVVLGAAPGDPHTLPTAILADILRGEGLEPIDLGGDTPSDSFLETIDERDDVVAVAVGVGSDAVASAAAEVAARIRRARPDLAVFVGGPAVRDEATARDLGATEYAPDALGVAARCLELAREART